MKREIPHIEPWKDAGVFATRTHYFIHATICFIGSAAHPESASFVLTSEVPADELGTAVIDAWDQSKFITPDDPYFDVVFGSNSSNTFGDMFADFAARIGYASGEALLRTKPKFVGASRMPEGIEISSLRWVGRGAWENMKDVPDIKLKLNADPRTIGEEVIEAFARCR